MKITFEIDDALLPSLEQYIGLQFRVENDELTKTQRHVRIYKDVPALIEDSLHQVVHGIVQQYPTDEIRAQLQAAAKIQAQIKDSVRPKRVG